MPDGITHHSNVDAKSPPLFIFIHKKPFCSLRTATEQFHNVRVGIEHIDLPKKRPLLIGKIKGCQPLDGNLVQTNSKLLQTEIIVVTIQDK